MLDIVRADGLMIVGQRLGDVMTNPRLIMIVQSESGPMKKLVPIMGSPKEITLGSVAFSCKSEDEKLERLYLESITGLAIPKKGIELVK